MTPSYEDLLKEAYTNITEPTEFEDRFTVPVARVFIEGKTTVLENFAEIADTLRRDPDHLMKHLLGELGTAGKVEGTRAVFSGKFEQEQINTIIRGYVEDYVICSECGKPDTRLVKTERVLTLRCDACGGHRPVRKRKSTFDPNAAAKPTEGAIMDVTPQFLSKRGDGVVKIDRYTMYVANAKPGQTVKIKITRIAGTIIFTERAE
ncbi:MULTISPECIES: translation initiation factor IF-2 subunit beta [unclassified Methanoculleus]|uniref:translation initiation factor IF-2 subunit beta n=1 Tax=unclassified Methanoculleus TaxID=2619537 RepID=UPI0025FF4CDE|nr:MULTISPECIES: translation initiation factor IF-2 subunit beta [unclassified Methanoculleus]MCK9318938.1 translation initiation factor IF-2 subunit beta [Methanoculleus sp.]MDD2254913.1 translation initiation factor IF-2 subunit beta [Methanoculleus sp.]MDD2786668.1 translation initiation factor IF-2 subunit beta [Methanoculleus sp.]MDD3215472.1 translation initiation factor IF-2 subunit beta [Methanoculleus sp.]MDD4313254.1 translation initiation factor IF-2 subunit beta [Methanoculleus sp.